jgi:hypothetical protein
MDKLFGIEFNKALGGTFPATWGQREFWNIINRHRPSGFYQMPWIVRIPKGCDVDRLRRCLTSLVSRHQALRTLLRRDGNGELWQFVHEEGTIPVWATELHAHDFPPEAPSPFSDFLWAEPPVDREFPLKIIVLTWNGVPHHVVCACSHMVVDGESVNLLAAELKAMLSGDDGASWSQDSVTRQPADQAREEATGARVQTSARSLAYFRKVFAEAPPGPFPAAPAKGNSPMWRGLLRSEAVKVAEDALVQRTGLASGPIFLAAAACVLSDFSRVRGALFRVPTSNRFSPELEHYVGALSQHAAVIVHSDRGTFYEMSHAVARGMLRAHARAQYNADDLYRMADEIQTQRPVPLDLSLLFNDFRPRHARARKPAPVPAPVITGMRQGEVSWELLHTSNSDLSFYVRVTDAGSGPCIDLAADVSCLPREEIIRFLLATERLLARAGCGDFPLKDTARVAGLLAYCRVMFLAAEASGTGPASSSSRRPDQPSSSRSSWIRGACISFPPAST